MSDLNAKVVADLKEQLAAAQDAAQMQRALAVAAIEDAQQQRTRAEAAESELQDWRNDATRAASERCGDEKHCTCVGVLRHNLASSEQALRDMQARYDAAQRTLGAFDRATTRAAAREALEEAPKWSDLDTTVRVGGSLFRCDCGANVFRKSTTSDLYRCNGCRTVWEGEKVTP